MLWASLWILVVLEGFPSEVGPGEAYRQEERTPSQGWVSGVTVCLKGIRQARVEKVRRQAGAVGWMALDARLGNRISLELPGRHTRVPRRC